MTTQSYDGPATEGDRGPGPQMLPLDLKVAGMGAVRAEVRLSERAATLDPWQLEALAIALADILGAGRTAPSEVARTAWRFSGRWWYQDPEGA